MQEDPSPQFGMFASIFSKNKDLKTPCPTIVPERRYTLVGEMMITGGVGGSVFSLGRGAEASELRPLNRFQFMGYLDLPDAQNDSL